MKRRNGGGYTIVEVIIVLAVSSAIFVAAAATFQGRQAKTETTQAGRDIESYLQSVANDVSSGYFPNGIKFTANSCGDQPPVYGTTQVEGGTNKGCVFLGKLVVFESDEVKTYPIVGRQFTGVVSYQDVSNLTEAKPKVVDISELVDTHEFRYGMNVHKLERVDTNGNLKAIAFITQLGGGSLSDNPSSGSRSVDLYGIYATDRVFRVTINPGALTFADFKLMQAGARVCFRGGNEELGELTLGSDKSAISTFLELERPAGTHCG